MTNTQSERQMYQPLPRLTHTYVTANTPPTVHPSIKELPPYANHPVKYPSTSPLPEPLSYVSPIQYVPITSTCLSSQARVPITSTCLSHQDINDAPSRYQRHVIKISTTLHLAIVIAFTISTPIPIHI